LRKRPCLHIFTTSQDYHIKSSVSISEDELIAGLRARKREIFEYLYDRYSAALYGVVSRIIREESIAEEVLHDAFLRIWDRIDSYDRQKGRLFTWMLNITRNLAIDKTRSKEISQSKKTGDIDKIVDNTDRGRVELQHEDTIGLKELLGQLPQEQQFVVEYLYLRGYTQSELAEEFNIPLGTVKTRLRLAMIALRSKLNVQ
jgi:RNA polymerase sigma-70 factor (ECF subfamily)